MRTGVKVFIGAIFLVVIVFAGYYSWMYGVFNEEIRYYEWLSSQRDTNIVILRGNEAYSNIRVPSGKGIREIKVTNKELRLLVILNTMPWVSDTCYVRVDYGRTRIFFVSYDFEEEATYLVYYYWSPP